MKLAIQQTLLPGADLKEKFQRAAAYGFNGVELAAWGFEQPLSHYAEEIEAASAASGIPVSSACPASDGDLVHPDPVEREERLARLVDKLKLTERLGARGVIALPIRPPVKLPNLAPVADEHQLITQLTVEAIKSALEQTPDSDARILLEPLNRYEAYYLRTIEHAAELCELVGSPRAQVMADIFHMNIEEADIAGAMSAVIEHIGHFHLADSNRLQPGKGHINFVEPFRVLRGADFDGWLALECRIDGDPNEALPETVQYIADCWQQAGA
jgi:sugar phosphate isomerase/epimerase